MSEVSPLTRDPLTAPAISVVGLGPGDWSQMTVGVLDRLLAADRIFLRTQVHPTVEPLRRRLRAEQHVESFDAWYDRASSFDELYHGIVDSLLGEALASARPIVYAVPGHPVMGERTVALLREKAPERGVAVEVLDGLSFLEPLAAMLNFDPVSGFVQLVDGAMLVDTETAAFANAWQGASPRLLRTGHPVIIAQVYDRRVATAAKLWLLERYPDTHPVSVVAAAGTSLARRREVALAELDHSEAFDHLTTLVVPPLDPLLDVRGLATLPYITARLRAPEGCPWDRKQTLHSLKAHLLEEAHEAVEAIDEEDPEAIAEELGDVLLLVAMLTQIAEEEGSLDLPHVIEAVTTKLIRRHPHVFGDLDLSSASAVLVNWERMKTAEREAESSALSGVPTAMPALIASQVMQRKAAALGFDWQDASGVFAKLEEELAELQQAAAVNQLEEAGDVIFAMVSLCRHLGVDAEEALRRANKKFRGRFSAVEVLCAERGLTLGSLDAAALDQLWREAKALEPH